MTTRPATRQPSELDTHRPVAPDTFVLAGRKLRTDNDISSTARYSDTVWPLTPALLQKHQHGQKLDFATLPGPYTDVAKELFYAELSGPLPEGIRRCGVISIRKRFSKFKTFADWLARNGQPRLTEVTPAQVDAFRRLQAGRDISPSWKCQLRQTVHDLWVYRDLLSDALSFDPTVVFDDWFDNGRDRSAENRTDRIPEQVLGPLLVWALRWVEEIGADILAARKEWLYLFHRHPSRLRGHRRPGSKTAVPEARAVLDRYRQAGRPLPGGPDRVNISHLCREIGATRCNYESTHVGKRMLAQAVAQLGVDDDSYLWTPMTVTIDNQLWLARMPYRRYPYYEQRLNVACYIVIAYLSGMRDSEVKHLRRGCLRTETSSDGRLKRHKLTSLTFKGETDPNGVTATWVVGTPVAKAIGILEQLQPPDQQWLFAPLETSHHRHRRRQGQRHANEVLSSRATNDDIAGFITWINDHCHQHGRNDSIPYVQGTPPTVISSRLRRTLAWFIARRPGGSIAGAIAYKHHTVQMFEGYAGTSASGFRAEVEAEQALARGEDLALMVERHEHTRLSGPAAEEAALRLREFGQHLRFAGTIPADRKQQAKLMTRYDPHIYPGRFVICVHNPDRALCHNGSASVPSLGECQPLACRNVALTSGNITEWRHQQAEIGKALCDGDALAPYLRHRLEQRQAQISALLGQDQP